MSSAQRFGQAGAIENCHLPPRHTLPRDTTAVGLSKYRRGSRTRAILAERLTRLFPRPLFDMSTKYIQRSPSSNQGGSRISVLRSTPHATLPLDRTTQKEMRHALQHCKTSHGIYHAGVVFRGNRVLNPTGFFILGYPLFLLGHASFLLEYAPRYAQSIYRRIPCYKHP